MSDVVDEEGSLVNPEQASPKRLIEKMIMDRPDFRRMLSSFNAGEYIHCTGGSIQYPKNGETQIRSSVPSISMRTRR